MTPLPNPTCPRCGGPNACAPAASGSFAARCWCEDATVAPALIAGLPQDGRGRACLCAACVGEGASRGTTPGVTFRPADASDALCIGVLGMQVYLDTYAIAGVRASLARDVLAQFATRTIESQLAAPDTRCVVAEKAGHLVGFAQLVLATSHERVPAARAAKLDRLYVQEAFTGAGLGTALLKHAETTAQGGGADMLWLTAWVGNRRALAFYPRRGYADVGATIHAIEDERHENRVFAKTLAR